ncbi:hypothetical protein EVAR_28635_1 [Eumeta japonica]|uniref:Uncharacterized protein n=1 Tax=Eumeta variegata TaxID=151549 RepID=A0A4C1XX15_EUMVA|nr:hypothetical protein EVAR_28635_1 [Eumeta japonica]
MNVLTNGNVRPFASVSLGKKREKAVFVFMKTIEGKIIQPGHIVMRGRWAHGGRVVDSGRRERALGLEGCIAEVIGEPRRDAIMGESRFWELVLIVCLHEYQFQRSGLSNPRKITDGD